MISIDRTQDARPWPVRLFGLGQLALCTAAIGSLLLTPPAQGQMALYPVTEAGKHELARIATSDGRSIISMAPISGGLVIQGQRPDWIPLLLDHGILALAVQDSGCIGIQTT
ncbi:hypothetical protein [Parerythrobacter aestuarii]|uniref:hypothetical protein n=1 Tax=Parerythrobacter aestuarii TaxID=3020909 RepID=UPI0024DEA6DC|nr:hypothetical protein [Parerythrobacter aestuarii]